MCSPAQTAAAASDSDDDGVLHIGGVRIRVDASGTGTLRSSSRQPQLSRRQRRRGSAGSLPAGQRRVSGPSGGSSSGGDGSSGCVTGSSSEEEQGDQAMRDYVANLAAEDAAEGAEASAEEAGAAGGSAAKRARRQYRQQYEALRRFSRGRMEDEGPVEGLGWPGGLAGCFAWHCWLPPPPSSSSAGLRSTLLCSLHTAQHCKMLPQTGVLCFPTALTAALTSEDEDSDDDSDSSSGSGSSGDDSDDSSSSSEGGSGSSGTSSSGSSGTEESSGEDESDAELTGADLAQLRCAPLLPPLWGRLHTVWLANLGGRALSRLFARPLPTAPPLLSGPLLPAALRSASRCRCARGLRHCRGSSRRRSRARRRGSRGSGGPRAASWPQVSTPAAACMHACTPLLEPCTCLVSAWLLGLALTANPPTTVPTLHP